MVKSSLGPSDIRRFFGREEEFYAVEVPFPDTRKQNVLVLADARRPHHRVDTIFHRAPALCEGDHYLGDRAGVARAAQPLPELQFALIGEYQ